MGNTGSQIVCMRKSPRHQLPVAEAGPTAGTSMGEVLVSIVERRDTFAGIIL